MVASMDLHSGGVAYAMATLVGYCDPGDEDGRRARPGDPVWGIGPRVQRVMVALGTLPGECPGPIHQQTWSGPGNTHKSLAVGDPVVVGQLLGTIVAHDGRVVERTVAPMLGSSRWSGASHPLRLETASCC